MRPAVSILIHNQSPYCFHFSAAANQHCLAQRVRPYAIGPRCPEHTPAALAGLPETPSVPRSAPRTGLAGRTCPATCPVPRCGPGRGGSA